MRKLFIIPLLLLVTGCSDIEALKLEVRANNIMTSSLKAEYETSSKGAYLNEKSFFSGDFSSIGDDEIRVFLSEQRESVLTEIEYYYELMDSFETPKEDILDLDLKGVTEVHYFLNSDKSVTEQMFIFNVPESFKRSITLTYSKGDVVNYEEMVHN